ncbi:MAG: hypothetical protein U9Q67_00565 [Patescibacteria group bacterium]|nr:hypothetical protein [Patescibacteria group bacterium]
MFIEGGGTSEGGPDPDDSGSADQEYKIENVDDVTEVTLPGGGRIVADEKGGIMSSDLDDE